MLKVRVQGYGGDGKPLDFIAKGWQARIVQHEMDHLNGGGELSPYHTPYHTHFHTHYHMSYHTPYRTRLMTRLISRRITRLITQRQRRHNVR